jgi:PadR family transcriptional regulator PadR
MPNESLPLLKGTLELLLLKRLSWGPMHGFGLAVWLETHSSGLIEVEDSALYQALRRMEGRGLVKAEWGITTNNRRARFYRLTTSGRNRLAQEQAVWQRYAQTVGHLLSLDEQSV